MKKIRVVGVGMTPLGRHGVPSEDLCQRALNLSLADARLSLSDIDGLVAVPSLSSPHFMQAHFFATKIGMFRNKKNVVLRTLDNGGASPISALFTATAMIRNEMANAVAIVGGDAVLSLDSREFLARADGSVAGSNLASPRIPHGYDRYAQWHMKKYGVTREQLAMVPVVMSHLAARHPDAMCRAPITLDDVLRSKPVGEVTNLLECARRADGACALVVASSSWYRRAQERVGAAERKSSRLCPVVVSTGEASGPLYPPDNVDDISEHLFSCERAASMAYKAAQLGPADIDFFGLYDCVPICLLRALEATKVCRPGEAGRMIEEVHARLLRTGRVDTALFPVNTHGGLQCFGAPWEVPAMFNVVEAVAQLTGRAGARQLHPQPERALVYGNGGIFSASAVAILRDDGDAGVHGGDYRF